MFKKILIANRGEIACRVIKTAQKMGIPTVAVYSEADHRALHVQMADESVLVGPPTVSQSYINIERVVQAALDSGADAVHPGYGFLSENAKFVEALVAHDISFIGPPQNAIEAMGDKITSKKIAIEANVNTVPGHIGLVETAEEAAEIAQGIGFPVMIKASAGGGGKGMRVARSRQDVYEGFESSRNEAANAFGDDRIFIEKFVSRPRHIEIQILFDQHGNGIFLGERECSVQRRNQKVIEEAPSPFLDQSTREAMGNQAVALAKAVNYSSAGTVEFIVDENRDFFFLEMNTRLQVEHPVTELITGIDLVEQMIRIAAGESLPLKQEDVELKGWAIESRLYAEDPYRNFMPSIGRLKRYRPPTEVAAGPMIANKTWHNAPAVGEIAVRNDTGVYEGGDISMHYDPMVAKLCTWAHDRTTALAAMREALDNFEVEGIGHNLPFISAVIDHPDFISGDITTQFIAEHYAEGFTGVDLQKDDLRQTLAACLAMHHTAEVRRTEVSGRLGGHRRRVGDSWVVLAQGEQFALSIKKHNDVFLVTFADGEIYEVVSDWTPGDSLAQASVNDLSIALKVDKMICGFRIRYQGADFPIQILAPRQAELSALMPEKQAPDTSNMLICPMPGLITRIEVAVGQEVQDGQNLCTVEAMKMENILRAERKGIVAKINSSVGDSLAVDEVIMEFEPA
ncbi:MAG: acetyl/propionyl/methylcrotonyl-CoA carboxylase subunit alpha [Aestuariivita sp.]|nr:acetyl/propionyl/methylcrotonyl-CoA carboxylase subunit alpha [Aestuariivita sp.]MCY4346062.1 acetyl/propionyl/methylcrotonyl-CoA carboxylase subunit alpha [Aestuariivita sp.]